MARVACGIVLLMLMASAAAAQTPQPFPRPGASQPQAPRPTTTAPQAPPQPAPQQPAPQPQSPVSAAPDSPTAASLGFPLYPTAQFLASYDAGSSQRFYIFGTTAPYSELVAFYRAQLKEKGDEIYQMPPTYMFQVGRFREETMAFPPGVTVKDWTSGGSQGYPNPKPGAQPARFPTIVMIVPAPPAAAAPAR